MENFALYLFAILFGLVSGIVAAKAKTKREADEFNEALMMEILERTVYIHAEIENDVIYFYDYPTSKFLCKGDTANDVLSAFNNLYPSKIAHVESGDEEVMKIFHQGFNFLNPEIKNLKV
jgi:hypothetical protein